MKFFSPSVLIALVGAPLLAFAQNSTSGSSPNQFTLNNFAATAGQPADLTWDPTTSGTVTLVLRSGASSDLTTGVVIVQGLANSGSYTWNVPSSITRGSDYTIEIVSDEDPTAVNYSHYFVIDSTVTVASSTTNSLFSTVTFPTTSGTSSMASVTVITGTSSSSTGSSTITSTGSSSSSTGMSSSQSSSSTTASSTGSIYHAGASAPRATAMAGVLGMVALGALAL